MNGLPVLTYGDAFLSRGAGGPLLIPAETLATAAAAAPLLPLSTAAGAHAPVSIAAAAVVALPEPTARILLEESSTSSANSSSLSMLTSSRQLLLHAQGVAGVEAEQAPGPPQEAGHKILHHRHFAGPPPSHLYGGVPA
jgi:hypothetical protein